MKNKGVIFKKNYKYVNVFYGIETLNELLYALGYDNLSMKTSKAKQDCLNILKQLMDLDIMYIYKWFGKSSHLNSKEMSAEEIINYIDEVWLNYTVIPEFYDTFLLGYSNWYINALRELGMTDTTCWETFVENKIGDFETWVLNSHSNKRIKINEQVNFDIFKVDYKYINLFKPAKSKLMRNILLELDYDVYDIEHLVKEKMKILTVLKEFMELDIFQIKKNKKLSIESLDKDWVFHKKLFLKKNSILEVIDKVIFDYSEWYYEKLISLGYSFSEDWKIFVEEKIGNLEKWIEENRPKK